MIKLKILFYAYLSIHDLYIGVFLIIFIFMELEYLYIFIRICMCLCVCMCMSMRETRQLCLSNAQAFFTLRIFIF